MDAGNSTGKDSLMLVLRRKEDESIIIGDVVKVTVNRIQGDGVILGIEAPHDVKIHRKEVWLKIQREAIEAIPAPPSEVAP
jgi:carbon storage regulator